MLRAFPNGSAVKDSACHAGDTWDMSSVPGSGRSSGKGNGHPLQYSCLGISMDRGAWQATVNGFIKRKEKRIDPLKNRRLGHWPMSSTTRVAPKALTLSSHHSSVKWGRKTEADLLDGALAGLRPVGGAGGRSTVGAAQIKGRLRMCGRGAPKAAALGPKPIFGSTTWPSQP